MKDQTKCALHAERARLWAAFQENGGRGTDLAERIDEIDRELGILDETETA